MGYLFFVSFVVYTLRLELFGGGTISWFNVALQHNLKGAVHENDTSP
jgi:hypothetical protein